MNQMKTMNQLIKDGYTKGFLLKAIDSGLAKKEGRNKPYLFDKDKLEKYRKEVCGC